MNQFKEKLLNMFLFSLSGFSRCTVGKAGLAPMWSCGKVVAIGADTLQVFVMDSGVREGEEAWNFLWTSFDKLQYPTILAGF